MDLEEFEVTLRGVDAAISDASGPLSIPDALKWIDTEWHTASRRARWMDLLGDYAGIEPFIVDGHSLIQLVIDNPLLALGKSGDPSFQILHAFHILERILGEFIKRSAVFDVVFWDETRHLALKTGVGGVEEASRSLARKLLFNHLLKIPRVSVYTFTGLSDPKWEEYRFLRKPMFALVSDGGVDEDSMDRFTAQRILSHRVFLYDLLTSGLALALLAGAEFRDSKILSFVYEWKSRRADNFIVSPVRDAYSTAVRALERESKGVSLVQSSTALEPVKTLREVAPKDVALKVASQITFSDAGEKALFYAFLVHLLLLRGLSTQDRARKLEPMQTKFKRQLESNFFPSVFSAVELAITSLGATIDVDVRVFIALVRFLAENNISAMQDVVGNDIANIVRDKLSSFSVPVSAFSRFAVEFLPSSEVASPPAENRLGLLPFSNKIFDDELAPIRSLADGGATGVKKVDKPGEDEGVESDEEPGSDEWDTSSEEEEEEAEEETSTRKFPIEVPRTGYFDDGILFNDTRHWHNHKKSLLPKHLGGEDPSAKVTGKQRFKKLRKDQYFMKSLHDQAATLTGASGATLHQIKIPLVKAGQPTPKSKQSHAHPTAPKTQKQSKADAIREQNLAQKAQKQLTESVAWLTARTRELNSETSVSSLEKSLSDLKRNPRSNEPFVAIELMLYRLHRLFQHWILDPQRELQEVRDKHVVVVLRTIKDMLEINYSTSRTRKCIQDVVNVLGFSAYSDALTIPLTTPDDRPLTFQFVELVKSKTQESLYSFMRIKEHPIEWQLRMFGEYMDRSMDSQDDQRVSFKPDAWQKEVLDAIDDYKSLLVVAPTSAGKTFISFYAMEKVLRGSNEGVIVYVAPTKALVSQVAAEIYARFSKDLNGRSCWAIHTRDYRIHDPQNCQILVTVPEMLAIMMLSPPLAKLWSPYVKYIILDEIHTIGQQEGGSVWEQILLLAPCPIIGLSATVGSPEKFNTWLESVQNEGGFQHAFVHHPHRYSHLRKFFYNIYQKPNAFKSITSHKPTGRMRYLHPITMLIFGPRSIPSDLALEAADTLLLYRALAENGSISLSTLDTLNPLRFFSSDRLLQQKDVIAYDAALKECLAPMVSKFDPRDPAAPLHKVIASLEDKMLSRVPIKVMNTQPTRAMFKYNLIHLVCDLHAQGDLPAIFFNFDRTDCEIMANTLHDTLAAEEEEWRATSPEWKHKLEQYQDWLSKAKDRERAAARAAKNKADTDDVKTETVEWQATFDPDAPLPQFSFAGQHTSYTLTMLEEEVKRLARWTSTSESALACLRRGIAIHHAGMNKQYRTLVESLFRRGFLRVIFATGTLALGINAPTKTSVFCGDSPYLTALSYRQCAGRAGRRGYDLLGKVVFYGLPMDRVQRLTLSKLPSLGANFPVTSTLILRLFNLLEGSEYAPAAVKAVQRFFRLPQVSFSSEEGKHQLLHHLRFSIDYLRRARLLDELGRPFNLFGIAAHLYYTEPNNFALVTLLRHGVLHRICAQTSAIQARRDFILLMSHLFGRRYLPGSYLKDENMAEIIKKSASMVVLPPLSDDAQQVLAAHEQEILRIFTGYAVTYGSEHDAELGPDTRLPLSGVEFGDTSSTGQFGTWLQDTSIRVLARSPFVANSGHDDQFESVADLARTARSGLSLNEHAIPSVAPIFAKPAGVESDEDNPSSGQSGPHATYGFALNAYILDFYTHGQVKTLSVANGIRRGDVWYLLEEFALTLMTVRGVLEQLIMRRREASEGSDVEGEEGGESEDLDSGFIDVEDPTERYEAEDGNRDGDGGKRVIQVGGGIGRVKPAWVAERDWRVLEMVYEATAEFDEKFKAMWA